MINKVKAFIKELRYKQFEREVNKARVKGLTEFTVDGFEFEVKEKDDY